MNSGTTKTTSSKSKTTSKLQLLQENNNSSNSDNDTSLSSIDDKQATHTNILDSTFTKDKTECGVENVPPVAATSGTAVVGSKTPTHNDHYHLMAGSALATTLAAKSAVVTTGGPQSYAMTPAENDPLYSYESYDIANLSSDDSTDDEDCPKKVNSAECSLCVHTHTTGYVYQSVLFHINLPAM